MGTLLDATLDDANLFEAWLKVRANQGGPGVDDQTIEHFGTNVFGRLQTLRDHVRRGEYRPQPLKRYAIPKPNGKLRYLAVPTVRDRVLQTAAARVLAPILERAFEHASYGYRSGHSVPMAVARVAYWRDQGYQWVVDADIESYFDNIDHTLLLAKLRRTLQDHSLLPLIELWLAAIVQPADGATPYLLTRGIPQGSPISPLLANLYLDDLDEVVLAQELRLVRFADDFIILCRDPAQAEHALRLTEEVTQALRLRLNREKTRLVHFDEGFRFLGVDFIRNIMAAADPAAAPWLIPDENQRRAAAFDTEPPAQTGDFASTPEFPAETATACDSPSHTVLPGTWPQSPAQTATAYDALPAGAKHSDDIHSYMAARPVAASDAIPELSGSSAATGVDAETAEADWPLVERVAIEHHDTLTPLLRTLVVGEPGVMLLKENERVIVARRGEQLLSWPLRKLDEIHIMGNGLISTALLRYCASQGVAVTLSDAAGLVHAHVGHPQPLAHAQRLLQQWQRSQETDWKLMLARALIHGKLTNQITVLRRYNRRRVLTPIEEAIAQIDAMRKRLPTTRSLDDVRGCEGLAARSYYGALRQLIPPEWPFEGRRRRPPTDPVNALLSFGYAMLYRTMVTLLLRQDINPYLGTLHGERAGHAALASDLIEEFRAPVIDTVVLTVILSGRMQPTDFHGDDDGKTVLLSTNARRQFVADINRKLRSLLIHPTAGVRMDYHRAMLWQVNHYRQLIEGKQRVYQPFLLR